MIHQSSVIDKKAKISKNVKIGPYCFIGPEVELGEKCDDALEELEASGYAVNGTTYEVHCHEH